MKISVKTIVKTKGNLRLQSTLLFSVILIFCSSLNGFSQTLPDAFYALRNEQPAMAKSVLLKLQSASPADPEMNYRLGNLYYTLGKKDSASYYFQKGIKPEDKVNYNFAGLGKIALDDKNELKAQEYFNKLTGSGKSRDPKAYTFVADAYFNSTLKDANRALGMLERAIGLDIKNIQAHLLMAEVYMALNNAGKAVTSYEYTIEADPKLAYSYMKIGQIYMNARNYEEAHRHFLKGDQ